MSRFPNIERRDSGPASQDRTSDEWFEGSPAEEQLQAYAVVGTSPRRNLPYLTSTERVMLDTSEVERQAREARDRIAKVMGVQLPPGALA